MEKSDNSFPKLNYTKEELCSIPEPDPLNEGEEITPLLLNWIEENAEIPDESKILAIILIRERDNFGFKKYDQHLKSGDGRDSKEDARQELGDALQYTYKAIYNDENVEELESLINILILLLKEKKETLTKIKK